MKARFEVNDKRFHEALRSFQAHSKRSVEENLRSQAKLLVEDIIKVTPPNKNFKLNKQGGQRTIRTDLARLFRASQARGGVDAVGRSHKGAETNLAPLHLKSRNRRGRVPKGIERIKARGLEAYKKEVLSRVGRLASGWKVAANALGAKIPEWIARHSRPGLGTVKVTGSRVEITIANKGVYSGLRNWVERGVASAMKRRYWQMIKRVKFAQMKAAQRAALRATA
jgi:hypothetical protein